MYSKPNGNCTNYGDTGGASFVNNIYFNGGLHGATGNFKEADPLFMQVPVSPTEEADFHIPFNSPAVGFGISQDFIPETDKDGRPRTNHIDVGAYQATDGSGVTKPMVSTPNNSHFYNLSGQRVGSNYHGIVISNWNKYFIK